uniref:Glycosyl transferase family 2 n=1 Tax=Candidatus Kentrum sp. LPFa TaxID=2126335 RepID=A0A450Y2N5_9GAMM|nr:MAG: Glycosyl transferase family 2 [Candidatus Kentron sp. LPFa]VFK35818.1 MAG: Glycosyl transferase family 2 [Candidatus Kentron sp. LPFa]
MFGVSMITAAYKTNRIMIDEYFDSVSKLICPSGIGLEVICIVDGDKDLYEYIQLHAENMEDNIRALFNDKNKGVSYSRNRAMKLAKFDYSLILDSDDIMTPDAIIAIVDFIKRNPDVDFAFGSAHTIDADNNLTGIIYTRDSFREFIARSYSVDFIGN